MDKSRTATIGNAILWIVTIFSAAALGKGSDQAIMLIIIPLIAGAVSMYLVAQALHQR
jgi:multisubunit Na+/H+ antiporter MnhG subunit